MIKDVKQLIPNRFEPTLERSKGFLGEFKKFAMRGNVIDLAIGVIIGGAFGKIVNSIVNDVVMSPLGPLLGKVDFKTVFITLNGARYPSLEAAKKAGAPVIQVGNFIQVVIEFTIVAFVVFLVVKQINRLTAKKEAAPPPPDKKECPQCLAQIPIKATRCMQCTQPVS
ncbi:MAG TPA: large conductance mechanosensitive channel protein MscL [Verrucomicrobiae bacterium]|nr:large conductance mechanosensitive channel protein MscL [Verrucomicrobiae bacterium]